MKTLLVGDPHATADALKEMRRLIDHIYAVAEAEKPDQILLLGDQYHTHSVIHLAVMTFWSEAFKRLGTLGIPVRAMVGNHDMSGNAGAIETSMQAHTAQVEVIDTPRVSNGILYHPYTADHEAFVRNCNSYPEAKTIICHQSFDGAQFDNGFYDPDGIDVNLIPQTQVISGHVHTPQEFGKVWYPGAPRWRTVADANTERAIWLVEHDQSGALVGRRSFPTNVCCRSIHLLEDRIEAQVKIPTGNVSVVVDVYGTREYVNSRKGELEGAGVRVRTFPDVEKSIKVRESDGIATAYRAFISSYVSKNGTPPSVIWDMSVKRIEWLRPV